MRLNRFWQPNPRAFGKRPTERVQRHGAPPHAGATGEREAHREPSPAASGDRPHDDPRAAPVPAAQELYRYQNDEGVIVLSSTLPPRFATRGYTVIDTTGRVVRVVPRQLTPEEIAARDAQRKVEEAERLAALERRRKDEELLRLYSSPDDVERAMERQVATIQGSIDTMRANLARVRTQKRNLESQAADIERAGNPIPARIIDGLRDLEAQIAEREAEIAERQEDIEATRADFAADAQRVRYLLGLSDDDGSGTG